MKIGIIGTGTIATAIVTGLCFKNAGYEFLLSPRNADKAQRLASKFSEATVCSSNQDVLDRAEWILISIQKEAFCALNDLKFKTTHKVVNIAADMQLSRLSEITGKVKLLAHAVPLPMIAHGFGPLLIYPEIKEVGDLFAPVSDCVYIKNTDDMRTLQLLTCVMSPYYLLLNEFAQFATEQGADQDLFIRFMHSFLYALTRRAVETPNCDLVELAHDMTPGGYNEQALNELTANGAIKAWRNTLDNLLKRMTT